VSKVRLEGTRIRAIVCQLEAASMPEHVWMHLDFKLGFFRRTLQQPCKASCRKRRPALGNENSQKEEEAVPMSGKLNAVGRGLILRR